MTLDDWLTATNARIPRSPKRDRVLAEIDRVIRAAGTTRNTLLVARCRGRIGVQLLKRLEKASAGERNKIRVNDHPRVESENGSETYATKKVDA